MNKVKSDYLGFNFVWFFGVVEDRNDPLKLGRVRVRCFGWHTDDIYKLPTSALPWASMMQPVTSAAISGIGTSPTGLVEGSWVVGAFMDGEAAQQPMVMGSIAGIPQEVANKEKGFNDPNGAYPIASVLKEPDTSKLARGSESNDDPHTKAKIKGRTTGIKTAVAPTVPTSPVFDGVTYVKDRKEWNEPNPRYGGQEAGKYEAPVRTSYPLNHVTHTEIGHIFEVDNTPNASRIHWWHTKGTFVEVQPDGTKISKIIGDNYTIITKDDNVFIKGSVNITVDGDVRMITTKNFYHEVGGHYFLSVGKDMITKIDGNEVKEVKTTKTTNIGADKREVIGGESWTYVSKDRQEVVAGDAIDSFQLDYTRLVSGNEAISVTGNVIKKAGGNHHMTAGVAASVISTTEMKIHSATILTIVGDTKIDMNPA
jgi:hypothetical protein